VEEEATNCRSPAKIKTSHAKPIFSFKKTGRLTGIDWGCIGSHLSNCFSVSNSSVPVLVTGLRCGVGNEKKPEVPLVFPSSQPVFSYKTLSNRPGAAACASCLRNARVEGEAQRRE
jgi:hypothetical protein